MTLITRCSRGRTAQTLRKSWSAAEGVTMSEMSFETLAERGHSALISGTYEMEDPPGEHGPRWGLSVILRPSGGITAKLDAWTAEILALTGAHHWATGSQGAAHITVRSLEPRRAVGSGDAAVGRYAAATARAASSCPEVRFELAQLLVTPISVMVGAVPTDTAADELSNAIAQSMADDGWYEAGRSRDIWYLNLVHFAGAVDHPHGLLDWAEARNADGAALSADAVDLVRWEFDGRRMVPVILASVALAGA